jgi:hypothetical protein
MASDLDLRPLLATPDPATLAAFRAQRRGDASYGVGYTIGPVLIIVIGALFAAAGLLFGFPAGILPVAIGVLVAVAGVIVIARSTRRWPRLYRLATFAAANGMYFYPTAEGPNYPGAIFGQGRGRMIREHFYRADGRILDYGNYQYTTGSGKSQTTHQWWFLALQLDRKLPHMVLDCRANNLLFGTTNLPIAFAKDQVLSLEGDFDEHFRLYCPKEYERDALYVFTPDLMALCIDEAGDLDLEIVDDWLFAYSSRPLDMANPGVHRRVREFVDTVGAKAVTQTDQYADDRVGGRAAFAANIVAPQGARLRRGVPVAAILVAVVIFGVAIVLRALDIW